MACNGLLDRVTADNGTELILHCRDGIFTIRVDGFELMSSRAHGSEEAMARLACAGLGVLPAPRVLVGGLGMGFTLRAALDHLPPAAEVTVAEVFPAVVEWCRGPLAHLAGKPLSDARVRVALDNVENLLGAEQLYDVILLDVDNGPQALSLPSNDRLYSETGLARLRRSLTADGVLAVWSASPDAAFARRLERCGFRVRTEAAPARAGVEGPEHTIYIARPTRLA